MPDVVLNTHVFDCLLDDKFVDKILKEKTHIFVAKCSYRKEYKARHAPLLNMLHKNSKRLRPFFHCKNADSVLSLPADLKKALQDEGASNCDIEIAALACDRNQNHQRVVLVSNDPHFVLAKMILERHGVDVLSRADFIE